MAYQYTNLVYDSIVSIYIKLNHIFTIYLGQFIRYIYELDVTRSDVVFDLDAVPEADVKKVSDEVSVWIDDDYGCCSFSRVLRQIWCSLFLWS